MRVRISSIKINPGRREAEPKAVEELARSIAAVGLLNPITLDQHNTLVAGLHPSNIGGEKGRSHRPFCSCAGKRA